MKKIFLSVLVPSVALSMFGAGCLFSHKPIPTASIEEPTATSTEQPSRPAVLPTGQGELVNASTSTNVAYVLLNGGSANVTRDGETIVAVENTELSEGDRIVVTQGTVSLVYPDTGESRLETGTDLTIVADASAGGLFTELRLAAGRVWTRFDRLFGNDEHFSVAGNGVVATVRGTGFGFGLVNGDVDVQVADHEVDVAKEDAEDQPAKLVAGEGFRVRAEQIAQMQAAGMKTLIRALSDTERKAEGFVFGTRRIAIERLRRPARAIRPFRSAPVIRPEIDRRLQILRRAALLKAGFTAPTRGILPSDIAPNTAVPGVNGPAQ